MKQLAHYIATRWPLACLSACLLTACLAQLEPEVGELRAGQCLPEDSDPDNDVSFKDEILPLLERPVASAGCGCHSPSAPSASGMLPAGLDLTSYAAVMRGGNSSQNTHVVPGDPCASLLVQKVSNAPPSGARMPPNGPPYMTPSERLLLSDWIAEGARDN